ncbi:hypothetical protein LLG10_03660 [bacterium]|nr:hypothetical protein [bacterium]
MSIAEFIETLRSDKSFLYEFVQNPEKKIHEEFGNSLNEDIKTELFDLHKKIETTIENAVLKHYISGEKKYKAQSKEHINNDQLTVDDPNFCVYTSGCSFWDCADTSDCFDSITCFDNPCTNTVKGPTCLPTDQSGCLDVRCSNLVIANNFCIDNSNCVDSECHNLHCGDSQHCTDEIQCTNTVECTDGGAGGCADSGCHNGSITGTTKCTDNETCLDDILCTNVADCSDENGCTDNPTCDNTGKCTDTTICVDNDCDDKGICTDTGSCTDKDGCLHSGECTHSGTCTDE